MKPEELISQLKIAVAAKDKKRVAYLKRKLSATLKHEADTFTSSMPADVAFIYSKLINQIAVLSDIASGISKDLEPILNKYFIGGTLDDFSVALNHLKSVKTVLNFLWDEDNITKEHSAMLMEFSDEIADVFEKRTVKFLKKNIKRHDNEKHSSKQ